VQIYDDGIYHPIDEMFSVNLTGVIGGAVLGNTTGTVVTIIDAGDKNAPPAPAAPAIVNSTGGCITLQLFHPAHNGMLCSI
jgi:hypothetical protein